MMFPRRRALACGAALALALVAWQVWDRVYARIETQVAQHLLRKSWERTLASGRGVQPWLGARIAPVARLEVPRLGADLFVLAGASDAYASLGGVLVPGTALPGAVGNSVVLGRRDTQFRFLQQLRLGDELVLETSAQARHRYRVMKTYTAAHPNLRTVSDVRQSQLTLASCNPPQTERKAAPTCYVVVAHHLLEPQRLPVRWPQMLARNHI